MHWSETEPSLGGKVPAHLTEVLDAHQVCMRGTWSPQPRCIALDAEIGTYSRCTIHAVRPQTCYLVNPGDTQCNKARQRYGLTPLSPETP